MTTEFIGQLAALGTAVCWTITSLSFEAAGRRVGSMQVNVIRLYIALGIFAILLTITRGAPIPFDAPQEVWMWLSLSGLVGFVMGDLFLFQAFVDVGARTAMVVYSLVPPLTAILGRIFLQEILEPLQILAIAVTMTGIILVVHSGARSSAPQSSPESRESRGRGILFAFLGAVGQAGGLVMSRYGAPTYAPFAATQIRVIAGIIGFTLLFTLTKRWRLVGKALQDRRAVGLMGQGAFFGPFLGVSLGLFAAQRTSTGITATLIATVPVLLIPVTVFVFRQRITGTEILGALLAVGGVALLFIG